MVCFQNICSVEDSTFAAELHRFPKVKKNFVREEALQRELSHRLMWYWDPVTASNYLPVNWISESALTMTCSLVTSILHTLQLSKR
jgi:hypothetical protein